MRVLYTEALSPIECDAVELDGQTCQNHDSLGESTTLAHENDESSERYPSCMRVRIVHAYERGMRGEASMCVCGDRDAFRESTD